MKINLLLITILSFSLSCVSIEKQINRGNYDQVVNSAVSKLKGKKKKSPKFVIGLEEALELALKRDIDQINALKSGNVKDADLQILRLYEKIENRQNQVKPLLPLRDKHGYLADINLINVTDERSKYENRATDFLYESALENLRKARAGNKASARKAYEQVKEMEGISGISNTTKGLLQESKELGITYFIVNPFINKNISLSKQATDQFLNFNLTDFSTTWQEAHLKKDRLKKYDYEVNFIFDDFKISPEKENTREYQDKKEIDEDTGRKNANGEKIMRKKEVIANVIELYQFKELRALGTLVITDLNTKKEIYTKSIEAVQVFENYASTYKGDERALSDISRRRIGGKPLTFPPNEVMLDDAIVRLKGDLLNLLKKEYSKY